MSANVQYINPENGSPAQGLYSNLTRVRSGDLYYISGQLAVGSDGSVVGKGDFDAQFAQVFKNLGDVLEAVGCDFNDVVKFNTYLVASQHIDNFMKNRQALFPQLFASSDYAPNTLLVVNRLVKEDFLIEVEAVARARD
ncbi:translation initiation inhibitor [Erwinia sp. OLTSP20]|uniref:RidA family protein n=1 Tax=unclassified Erwinia TaxID=2622719 RepID=UPI000C1776A3|nr:MULTISPECIES: RidA family protein [unclassified Erwinia]PIJ50138.1 translation initiation inhibitor [Erwinia sp. OAMSP11]PIJ71904.1 translation initiation inhibitor [Erwinia sp. OLSSP12]PIJ81106.1 translation initiation inhibitor [Erwinia sp. OLCASP19]PIJ83536.1 translation initiation inhibitor [Erwinia sp. OLMTSP26]PIJ86151.1 translation initiation inhibitor [Erwinia sp. OLMDSP33]